MTFHKPGQVPEEFIKDVITSTAAALLQGGGAGSGRPAGYRWTTADYEARVKHKLKYTPTPEFKAKLVDSDNEDAPNGKAWVIYDKWENWRNPIEWMYVGDDTIQENVEFPDQQTAEIIGKNLSEALAAKPEGKRYIVLKDDEGNPMLFDALKMKMVWTDEGVSVLKQQKFLENEFTEYLKELANTTDPAAIEHAMNQYKGSSYIPWNGYLRAGWQYVNGYLSAGKMGTGENPSYEKSISYLDDAFIYKGVPIDKSGLSSDNIIPGDDDNVLIWRGISGGKSDIDEWLQGNGYHYDASTKSYKDSNGGSVVGNVVVDKGFGSCAYQESFSKSWGSDNYIHLKVPKGTHVLKYGSEYERVIPRGGAYLITKINVTSSGKVHIWATLQKPVLMSKKKLKVA